MPAAVPHDPAHHAHLSYTWRDEYWHLIDTPDPAVVLVSSSVSKGDPYPTLAQAEAAFWRSVASSILTHDQRVVSVIWPTADVEAAVLIDPGTGLFHLACRDGEAAGARWFTTETEARTAWIDAVRAMIADRFPGWTVWTSDIDHWWATRDTDVTREEVKAGIHRTLTAGTPLGLVDELEKT